MMIICTRMMTFRIKISGGFFRKKVLSIRISHKSGMFMNSCVGHYWLLRTLVSRFVSPQLKSTLETVCQNNLVSIQTLLLLCMTMNSNSLTTVIKGTMRGFRFF